MDDHAHLGTVVGGGFVINFVPIKGYKIVLGSSIIDFKRIFIVIFSILVFCWLLLRLALYIESTLKIELHQNFIIAGCFILQ